MFGDNAQLAEEEDFPHYGCQASRSHSLILGMVMIHRWQEPGRSNSIPELSCVTQKATEQRQMSLNDAESSTQGEADVR